MNDRLSNGVALRDAIPYDRLTLASVPLIRDDEVLGVLSVARAAPETFSELDEEALGLLGSQAALAVANARLLREVSELAVHDGLTGLFNRRHFDIALDRILARCRRRPGSIELSAIIFDLDHFGRFNREHGHLAGDEMLRLFAGMLYERMRAVDLVARYGGEEFVAILEECSVADAAALAETIRADLEGRFVVDAAGHSAGTTVSAGCAALDPEDIRKEALIGGADEALFAAKRGGRNRVVAAG